jgi:2'-5' RNA ligase
MHGVVSLLDEAHNQLVQAIWAAMEAELGIVGARVRPYPHFSYHVAEHYDLERLEPVLEEFAAWTEPFTVRTAGLGLFTGGLLPVLYVTVVRSPQLTRLQQALWPRLATGSAGIAEYYHPDQWVPHITLGQGDINMENLPAVLRLLNRYQFEWSFTAGNIAVLYNEGEEGDAQGNRLYLHHPFSGLGQEA